MMDQYYVQGLEVLESKQNMCVFVCVCTYGLGVPMGVCMTGVYLGHLERTAKESWIKYNPEFLAILTVFWVMRVNFGWCLSSRKSLKQC